MNKTKQIQQVQLQILKDVIEVLAKHELTYIAVGGTALGAYRHQGFIPWDDDIDIAMPRKDYDKFLTLQEELPTSLFIQNYTTDKNYPLYFTKVRRNGTKFVEKRFQHQNMHQGIFIDIFPLDRLTRKLDVINKIKHQENIFRRLVKKSYKQWFYKCFYGFKDAAHEFKNIEKLIQQESSKNDIYLGSVQANDYFTETNLFPIKSLPFEDINISVANDLEYYLENKYGDYMRIPEKHERRLHNLVLLDLGQYE